MAIQSHSCVIPATMVPLVTSISPAAWNASLANGASPADQNFEALPIGGLPPYTYSWALIGPTDLSITAGSTSKTCTVRATGSDSVAGGTLRVTVTDSFSEVVTKDAAISVVFGTPS